MSTKKLHLSFLIVILLSNLSICVYGDVQNFFCGDASQISAETAKVILQNGTAGTSTIYTNSTSAKASVEAPLFDYVDNNDCDVDSSGDIQNLGDTFEMVRTANETASALNLLTISLDTPYNTLSPHLLKIKVDQSTSGISKVHWFGSLRIEEGFML